MCHRTILTEWDKYPRSIYCTPTKNMKVWDLEICKAWLCHVALGQSSALHYKKYDCCLRASDNLYLTSCAFSTRDGLYPFILDVARVSSMEGWGLFEFSSKCRFPHDFAHIFRKLEGCEPGFKPTVKLSYHGILLSKRRQN